MAKENTTIRIKPEPKTQKTAFFKTTDMDLNAVTYAAMDNAEKGEDMYGSYDSVSDLMEALNA